MTQKHFSLVEHPCWFVHRFLRMNEDGSKEEGNSILYPQLFYPAGQITELIRLLFENSINILLTFISFTLLCTFTDLAARGFDKPCDRM